MKYKKGDPEYEVLVLDGEPTITREEMVEFWEKLAEKRRKERQVDGENADTM